MMLRTLIVDDEPLARQRIRDLLRDQPDIEVIGECADGEEAVLRIEEDRPELVFLDIQMPEMDGFEVMEAVGSEQMPTVIFVTAFDEFALRAFEAHAIDYLLKPFYRPRFQAALERARAQVAHRRGQRVDERIRALVDELPSRPKFPARLVVRVGQKIHFVRTDEVDWIDAEGNYVRLHVGKRSYLLRETMTRLEERLNPRRFVRIHRSTIVNVERIKEIESMFKGNYVVILQDGTKLTSTSGYRSRLNELIEAAF
ncbi:MAG TPA: LytTR family DNA-binding domain-containing protein [Longimicrobiaceae bacterium]|nr:LytTR family DNA-binding domain-containing protein [Longimicrobiaceae bacterium]